MSAKTVGCNDANVILSTGIYIGQVLMISYQQPALDQYASPSRCSFWGAWHYACHLVFLLGEMLCPAYTIIPQHVH